MDHFGLRISQQEQQELAPASVTAAVACCRSVNSIHSRTCGCCAVRLCICQPRSCVSSQYTCRHVLCVFKGHRCCLQPCPCLPGARVDGIFDVKIPMVHPSEQPSLPWWVDQSSHTGVHLQLCSFCLSRLQQGGKEGMDLLACCLTPGFCTSPCKGGPLWTQHGGLTRLQHLVIQFRSISSNPNGAP